MNATTPRYHLLVECVESRERGPAWRFVLCHQPTGRLWTAQDHEPGCDASRASVLALVRGLEALPEPAQVTVVSSARHIRYGLEQGVSAWSANSWKWERFGRLVTIRDDDLWRRVGQALQIHQVECRSWRVSVTDHSAPPTKEAAGACRPSKSDRCASRSVAESPEAFSLEPALLVVRKPKRVLRIDRNRRPGSSDPRLVRASVG